MKTGVSRMKAMTLEKCRVLPAYLLSNVDHGQFVIEIMLRSYLPRYTLYKERMLQINKTKSLVQKIARFTTNQIIQKRDLIAKRIT